MKHTLFFISIISHLLVNSQDADIQLFANGFTRPVDIKHANDTRLFIVEQDGVISIVNSDGSVNPTPFLDIDSHVGSSGNEQGLLAMAFHPNYTTNGVFFVHYTNNSGNTVISKFTVSSNPDIADSNSEQIVLTASQPYSNHNGGAIAFGNDGYLYIALGDGGAGGDPGNRSQNLNTLLGKLLRIDVDNGSTYSIPNDNPFLNDNDPNTLPEIWAYGLRNPWRFSFDRQTHNIWIGDVGQNAIEEIDMASSTDAGLNYGWRCYEGNSTFNTSGCPSASTLTFPVAQYNQGGNPYKCSITGGYVYRGTEYTDFQGLYFFGDYCSGEIATYNSTNGTVIWNPQTNINPSTFGEASDGTLYVADLSGGGIYKVIDTTLSTEEFNDSSYQLYPNPADETCNIEFKNTIASTIKIYNISGQVIEHITDNLSSNLKLTTQNYSEGVYIIEFAQKNNTIFTDKLIIQH